MFDPTRPLYIPLLLPGDRDSFATTGEWDAVMLSASYGVHSRTRELCDLARARSRVLLVDPKTAHYQYEGYLSMEDLRRVPYSPGAGTLGTLWQPAGFAARQNRSELIDDVFAAQRYLAADVLLAPYFLVSDAEHPWLEIAATTLAEAVARDTDRPVGAIVCVEIDAVLRDAHLETIVDAFLQADPALWMLVVVNHDEREASPDEMRAVLRLIERLGASGTPVVQSYAGRGGLVAAASGAAGYVSGALELEAHPKRYFREGLINLHTNSYYLRGCMCRLPVRLAAAVAARLPEAWGLDDASTPITRLVSRRRVARALRAKRAEIRSLATVPGESRHEHLRAQLASALTLCTEAQHLLAEAHAPERLPSGAFHYLEVMNELVGGPAASIPDTAGI